MADSSPPTSTVDSAATTGHLSIGEVLALLLEEFPDVTISKIRFLESQGLIDPERTASGYRKFYANDVDLLRCILREQRENYLPLRVIKDRIDAGEIDPTNENPRPRGIKNVTEPPAVPEPARHPSAGEVARARLTNRRATSKMMSGQPAPRRCSCVPMGRRTRVVTVMLQIQRPARRPQIHHQTKPLPLPLPLRQLHRLRQLYRLRHPESCVRQMSCANWLA